MGFKSIIPKNTTISTFRKRDFRRANSPYAQAPTPRSQTCRCTDSTVGTTCRLFDYNPDIVFGDGEDMPATSYSIDVTGEYKRMYMIGADAAIPAGDFVFRLEGAYFPMRHFQTNANSQLFMYSKAKTRPRKLKKSSFRPCRTGLDT